MRGGKIMCGIELWTLTSVSVSDLDKIQGLGNTKKMKLNICWFAFVSAKVLFIVRFKHSVILTYGHAHERYAFLIIHILLWHTFKLLASFKNIYVY